MTEDQIDALRGILTRAKADGQIRPEYQHQTVEEMIQDILQAERDGTTFQIAREKASQSGSEFRKKRTENEKQRSAAQRAELPCRTE